MFNYEKFKDFLTSMESNPLIQDETLKAKITNALLPDTILSEEDTKDIIKDFEDFFDSLIGIRFKLNFNDLKE